jgi:hypothetical protein
MSRALTFNLKGLLVRKAAAVCTVQKHECVVLQNLLRLVAACAGTLSDCSFGSWAHRQIPVVGLASASRARSTTLGHISEYKRNIWSVLDHVSVWSERQPGLYITACPPCLQYSLARFDKNPANIEHVDSTSTFGWSPGLLDFWTSGLLDFWTSGLLDFLLFLLLVCCLVWCGALIMRYPPESSQARYFGSECVWKTD